MKNTNKYEWKQLKDKKPKKNQEILVWDGKNYKIGHYQNGILEEFPEGKPIILWMKIPELPPTIFL